MPSIPATRARNPWAWIPTLYFAEGIPYVVAMSMSVILYKRLEISNADIALYTSWLYLPWVIKPLWSPCIEMFGLKRQWIWLLQLLMGALLASVALILPGPWFLRGTLAFFWLVAFSSATHDIAADGFYMLALNAGEQAWFVGVRSTFYRLAMIAGQGLLVMLAGVLETGTGNVRLAWTITFYVVAALFISLGIYHRFMLPRPAADVGGIAEGRNPLEEFFATFVAFFRKPQILRSLAFLLFYRLAEAQALKVASLFLLEARAKGGLGLSTSEVGFVYGTVGVIALTLGGILGGFAVARQGLRFWLFFMVAAIHLPNLVFVYLAYLRPENLFLINACIALEQFGYGFGFTAYMVTMLYIARGEHQTAHYAICTGFMALGMMLPGMFAGRIQEALGYQHFFVWVMIATIPGFIVTALIKPDSEFGRKVAT